MRCGSRGVLKERWIMPSAAHSIDQFVRFFVLRYLPAMLALALLVLFGAAAKVPSSDRWEQTITKFEEADKQQAPPQNATLFVGSSSIAFWDVQKSFPDLTLIKRGFGGSLFRDATHYADRIVIPYKPKTIVLYEGDNDLDLGLTADEVFGDFKAFAEKVHGALPESTIVVLSIKPSIKRWAQYDEQKKTNKLIEDYTKANKNLLYVDVGTALLGADGKPRADLLQKDGLHLNEEGYKVWASILTPILSEKKS
jgi:lysophospholipase L1-like esterase